MNRRNALQLVKDLYGTQRREGLDKFSSEHSLDVVTYCFLHLERDNLRAMRILNVAILHDVVEDFSQEGYTLEKVQSVVGLGQKETRLLNLLTRKKGQEAEYLQLLFQDEDAARIKLADRIANCRDLAAWVQGTQGFPPRARRIYEKYKRENAVILELIQEHFQAQAEDPDHVFFHQIPLLQKNMAELDRLYAQYFGAWAN